MSESKQLNKHMGIVGRQAKCFKSNNVCDFEDYVQVGAISLLKAIRKHDPAKGKLSTYSWQIIYRDIKRNQTKFNKRPTMAPDDFFFDKQDFWESIPDSLTEEEFRLIEMKLEGYNTREIAKELEVKCKDVEILLKSAIEKIKLANEEK